MSLKIDDYFLKICWISVGTYRTVWVPYELLRFDIAICRDSFRNVLALLTSNDIKQKQTRNPIKGQYFQMYNFFFITQVWIINLSEDPPTLHKNQHIWWGCANISNKKSDIIWHIFDSTQKKNEPEGSPYILLDDGYNVQLFMQNFFHETININTLSSVYLQYY
jgi:hypothetical protein